MSDGYLPVRDCLPTRSRGVVTRKKTASARRRYVIELYESHTGEWVSLVRTVGPGVRDTGLGVDTKAELQMALRAISDRVLADTAAMGRHL